MDNNFRQKYLMYKSKYLNLKNNLNKTGGSNKKIDIMLFKADWCGHCTHFKPTWEKIAKKFESKFNFFKYDADNDKHKLKEYKVDAFPTILVKDGDIVRPYDGDRSEEELTSFLNNLVPV